MTAVMLTLVLSCLYFVGRILEADCDPREPPLVRARVPLIGHVIGILREGPRYFIKTSARTNAQAYTLKMLNQKMYIITSPALVNYVSRSSKSISFNPFIVELGTRMCGTSATARAILERNLDGSEGRDSYVLEVHDATVAAFAPGEELNRLTMAMLTESWERHLRPLLQKGTPTVVGLQDFLSHLFLECSSISLYGPNNPVIGDPIFEKAFWEFDKDMNMLIVNALPDIIARKGHRAREYMAKKFKPFIESYSRGSGSHFSDARFLIPPKYGMPYDDMARLEVGVFIGIWVNTVPANFYLLFRLFSSPDLLWQIRGELAEQQAVTPATSDTPLVLQISKLRSCALLNSTYQEVLRVHSEGASARLVTEDTVIEGGYLLKKGAILQVPNAVMHRDKAAWGDGLFRADRFVTHAAGTAEVTGGRDPAFPKKMEKVPGKESWRAVNAVSYRPFGGGSTLCPGRHFATTEILGLTALVVTLFDAEPVEGQWTIPRPKQDSVVEAVFPPEHDVKVRLVPRDAMLRDVRIQV